MASPNWTFFRAGGVDQVALDSGADLESLAKLDKKLWVALACPTTGTEIDEKTLEALDTDKDSRIRPPEILEAVAWAKKVYKSLDPFFEESSSVPLDAFAKTDEGKAVVASAKRILEDQGKGDAKAIDLADVLAMKEVFASTRFNGDGIIPAEAAGDDTLKKIIEDMITVTGSVEDRSGKPGLDQPKVDAFFKDAEEVIAWATAGKAESVLLLGDKTAAAFDALVAVEAKVRDFFTRCQIAAFDPRGASLLGPSEAELGAISQELLSADRERVAALPVARIEANAELPLDGPLNPAWAAKIAAFREAAVKPVVGDVRHLTEKQLDEICAKLAPYREWKGKAPDLGAAKLGAERLSEMVAAGAKASLDDLIAKDKELEPEYTKIALVEKAVRLRRDLVKVLRNFVNFSEFYGKKKGAFQAGTLFLDARSCDLCIRVNDAGKHATLAGLAKAYLAYCDCTRVTEAGPQKMTIVAAFTAGDVDNLMVGRNGVFYDRKGNDWDATIVNIVENPISVRQAFWSPYKKLVRLIEEQVAKRAAEKEKAANAQVESTATSAANADQAKPEAAADPKEAEKGKGKVDVGTVAALGVAIAGMASFLGLIFGKFLDLGIWMPLGVIALLLVISGPSMLIAWLKLRQRNLGPILDANGWAVNARCKINVPFGGSLTAVAKLPEGASRSVNDPYAEKPVPVYRWVFLAILLAGLVAWALGKLDGFLPEKARSSTVLPKTEASAAPSGSAAPAAAPEKK
ncbi:MAG: hypothetical protein JST00_00540 [Deltaproteobacteria bacterium]|nr:hypothetical protein [Deltaproteobacteria bacterium]